METTIEKKKKSNKVTRYTALALLFTLITTCLLAGTLAKYVTTLSGYDSARVATFEFEAGVSTWNYGNAVAGSDTALETNKALTAPPATINIFNTTYYNAEGVETVGAAARAVAPGVGGYFRFGFSGAPEVATRLSMSIEETQTADSSGNEIPLFYIYDGKYYANDAALTEYSGLTSLGASTGDPANIWINTSNSDTTPTYIELYSGNYGGDLNDLATDSAGAIGRDINGSPTDDVIPPGTNLAGVTITPALLQVEWVWPFEVLSVGTSANYDIHMNGTDYGKLISDVYDTAMGVEAATGTAASIILDIDATLTQVD